LYGFTSTRMEISRFLKDMFCLLDDPQFDHETDFVVFQREKNVQTMLLLEFDNKDVIHVLRTLGIEDYHETLRDDMNPNGMPYFVFMKFVQGHEIYIKIRTKNHPRHAVLCMSFHVAEHSMIGRLPYGIPKR
jgi:hypothetical protein